MTKQAVVVGAVVLALAGSGVASGPASAQAVGSTTGHGSVHDRRGDAPAGADITQVSVTQTSRRVTATIHVRGLTRAKNVQIGFGGSYYGRASYDYDVSESAFIQGGRVHVEVDEGEDGIRAHCKGVTAHWDTRHDVVRLSSPVKCGPYAHWSGRQFSAFVYDYRDPNHSRTDTTHRLSLR